MTVARPHALCDRAYIVHRGLVFGRCEAGNELSTDREADPDQLSQ